MGHRDNGSALLPEVASPVQEAKACYEAGERVFRASVHTRRTPSSSPPFPSTKLT